MTTDQARLRLGLTPVLVRELQSRLQKESLPNDRDTVDRWLRTAAEAFDRANSPDVTPYAPIGFMVSYARQQHATDRRRKRADALGKTLEEDRKAFTLAQAEAENTAFEEVVEELSPPPPREDHPFHHQLLSDWTQHCRNVSRIRALERLGATDGPVAELAARTLDRIRSRWRRPDDRTFAPYQARQDRLQAYLEGRRDHLALPSQDEAI